MEQLCVFSCGAVAYGAMELLFRGHTHWTMPVTGGICFLLFYLANVRLPELPLIGKCVLSCFIITTLELAAGLLLNKALGLGVWDYSTMPLNFMGQICPLFSFFWFLMGIPMTYAAFFIRDIFSLIKQ